jgi:hypothetical protein
MDPRVDTLLRREHRESRREIDLRPVTPARERAERRAGAAEGRGGDGGGALMPDGTAAREEWMKKNARKVDRYRAWMQSQAANPGAMGRKK